MMVDAREPIDELLGAYSLDAVDEDERRRVEAYLEVDSRARDEVEAYRETAAMLAFGGAAAPPHLWERIASELEERAPEPGPVLARVLPQQRRRPWAAMAGAAAAAAVVAAGAAVAVTLAVRDGSDGPRSTDEAIAAAYEEAAALPDARTARLESEDAALIADAVVEPNGTGFLSAGSLPALPDGETYQLWGVYADSDVISLGVIGNRPRIEAFSGRGDLDAIVITRERASGVVSSTNPPLLSGTLS